jgi:1,2-diacylglycerol 3-beta-galactosyltransferase
MSSPDSQPKRILFLFSDTGGGHRSATDAIIKAVNLKYPDQVACEMVDIFKDYAPPPLNHAPAWYPQMVKNPQIWELFYDVSDGYLRTQLFSSAVWPYIRRAARQLIKNHPSDLIVSVHPGANAPILQAMSKQHVPFVTVITDLVTFHAFWADRRADLVLVPTEPAKERAIGFGLEADKVKVVGQPVDPVFSYTHGNKSELRSKLGWPGQDNLTALLMGGGEGSGPIKKIAQALNKAGLPITLIIVAGRNDELKTELEHIDWSIPVKIYSFVDNMPDIMQAGDFLISKAGPGTISEAFIAGLPLILYSRYPGQEDGNVAYAVIEGAATWAPDPDQVVSIINSWIKDPDLLKQEARASSRLAKPHAAEDIADILIEMLGLKQ